MLGALLVTFLFVGYAHSYKVNYLIGESEEVEDFEGDDPEPTDQPTDPSPTIPSTTPSGAVTIMASSLLTSAIAYIIL